MKMKKSFTLVELLVTIGIIVLLATASLIPLKTHQDKAHLDAAVTQIKDAISKTQNYAFAPEQEDISGYAFVLNISENNQDYYGTTLEPRSYGIFTLAPSGSLVPATRTLVNSSLIKIPVQLQVPQGCYSFYGTDLFQIFFRLGDGIAGCSCIPDYGYLRYYDAPDPSFWTACTIGGDYTDITISYANRQKRIRINKISGQLEVCIPQASGECQVI